MVAGSSACTVSFLFDEIGTDEVYFATAAHCVSSVGQSVSIRGINNYAEVAWIHPEWNDGDSEYDMALLQVDEGRRGEVEAGVRGHEGNPTGITAQTHTTLGDLIEFSGHGVGFGFSPITRENRVGVLWSDAGTIYRVEAPIVFGDSGGPVLHADSDTAFGIVSAIVAGCCVGPGVWIEGPTIRHVVEEAAEHGFPIELRTV